MRCITALLLLLAAPALARAETAALVAVRPLVVVEEPALRLGDLFENAGPRADVAIGAAPAPGRRMVVEAVQLHALARAHGLAWRPLSAHERAVVERPGRPVPREEIEAVLRADLERLGLDPEAELDLGALLPPMVPPAALLQLAVEGLSLDNRQGRFAATLVVAAEGMPTQRLRLAGRALPTQAVVVAARRMALGEVVRPEDVREIRLRAERVRPGALQRLDQVVGRQLRRPQGKGLPFTPNDLGAPAVVGRNALVVMLLDAPGMTLTAQGRALQQAARGEIVPVVNLASNTVVEAQAIGPGRVRVTLGATPLPARTENR